MKYVAVVLLLPAFCFQNDYTFTWPLKKSEAWSYAVTQITNKNAKTKFVIYGSELNSTDGTNTLAIVTYKDIAYHLLFMLPKDKIKVGGSWKYERLIFEEGFNEMGTLVKVKIIGRYILRKTQKDKKGEYAVIEGAFNVYDVKRTSNGKEEMSKTPQGRIDTSTLVNLADGTVEKASFAMDVQGRDIDKVGSGPMPKKFTIKETLELKEKISLEENDKIINAINKAIEKGAAGLRKLQKPDGSFVESSHADTRVGATALCVMALVHSGMKVSDPAIQRAFAFMTKEFRNNKNRKTYDVALLCMAIETKYLPLQEYDDMARFTEDDAREHIKKNIAKEDLDILKEAVAWFRTNQTTKGTWGYPEFKEYYDHSNTQYALLALKSAARCGVEVPVDVWQRSVQHWINAQGITGNKEVTLKLEFFNDKDAGITTTELKARPGGWGYLTGPMTGMGGMMGGGADDFEKRKYGAMTCAGLTSLIICESELFAAKKLDDKLRENIDRAKKQGLAWLQENFSMRANVPAAHFFIKFYLYYLYSLERVGVLYGIKKFGDHDWYHEGALMLINAQKDDGTWAMSILDLPLSDTAFALLFLKKATLKVKTRSN